MTLNCVVVDDSAIQRLSIVKLIENHPSLNLIAEYNSALETKNGLNTHKVDLIFLDIEMPVLNGIEKHYIFSHKLLFGIKLFFQKSQLRASKSKIKSGIQILGKKCPDTLFLK